MVSLFFSYSHRDEDLRDRLEVHLAMLKNQGVIETWHDRRITVGDEVDAAIDANLASADIILLLVSPDFLASKYCYSVEARAAMERHAAKTARVIPVILRPCEWRETPFGKLLAAPSDGRPVTKWPDIDEAFLDITQKIRAAAGVTHSSPVPRLVSGASPVAPEAHVVGPRSSNLRLRKQFTDADRDRFFDEAFEYMARFFEQSLSELKARNPGIDAAFKLITRQEFSAVVYRDGKTVTRVSIRADGAGGFTKGITYSANLTDRGGFNELMRVENDEQGLFLKPLGMNILHRSRGEAHLTFEGAAEYYWSMFIEPLQR